MKATAMIWNDGNVSKGNVRIVDATMELDVKSLVEDMDAKQKAKLLRLLADDMAASDFVEAFDDDDAPPIADTKQMTERGTIILDLFTDRAFKLGRMPEDWSPPRVEEMIGDADRLQEAIVEGRIDEALQILRDVIPDHQFLSPAAQKMLAGIRNNQPGLPL